jgi:superoxide oxidase
MRWNNSKVGYGWLAITFHWVMLLLFVGAYCTMEFKSIFPNKSAPRELMALLHYGLGLSVFLLVWLRLLARFGGSEPSIVPTLPRWQMRMASVTHWALYALMIALPLLGWLTLSAKGVPVILFGNELPFLLAKNPEWAEWLKEAHETGASVGYFLIGLHAVAALYHHYVRRDNTIRLMWFRS